jgi:REP element-mobilizing transposase RayT
MTYDPRLHHRTSHRLNGYDYSQRGIYFITVCVEARACILIDIVEDGVRLTPCGQAVQACWESLPEKYPGAELDALIIMPNHVHAVLGLCPEDTMRCPPLGTVMGFFKYQSTKAVNLTRGVSGQKLWQRDYFDHVVRHDRALERIREYIATNSQRWTHDAENVDGSGRDSVRNWVKQWDIPVPKKGGETPPLQGGGV